MEKADKAKERVLRFLSQGNARATVAAAGGKVLLDAEGRGTISVNRGILAAMMEAGMLCGQGDRISLTGRRMEGAAGREIGSATVDTGDGPIVVAVNLAESPLGQLMRRKDRDGAPFLSRAEFDAGERLRSDYTRGQIMPRLGANWEASVSSGRREGGVGDLTDAALAARMRVEKAIRAVGPELSGVLVDVCCFLKGMETVEIERGWPVRSAKNRAEGRPRRAEPALQSGAGAPGKAQLPLGHGRLSAIHHMKRVRRSA
jgi:hypothetical protein